MVHPQTKRRGEVKGRVERWRDVVGFDIFCVEVSPAVSH
jgi:hypothetical protein